MLDMKKIILNSTIIAAVILPLVSFAQPQAGDRATYNVFAECGDYGGDYEKILVPAGVIDVCMVPLNNEEEIGKAWYGLVPFGLVKKEVKLFGTNVLETTELQSFQQGH